MKHAFWRAASIYSLASILVACDGSGDLTPSSDSASSPVASSPGGSSTTGSSNQAPTLMLTANHNVLVGRELVIRPSVSDPDGQSLTFSVSNAPAWLTFSAATGELRGTPSPADVASFGNVRVTVSDGQTEVSAATAISVVASTSGRATLSWSAPNARTDGTPLTNLAGFRVYYGNSAGDLRYVIEIKNPGARSWVVEDLTIGTWYFAATAFDATNAESDRSGVASKSIV